LIGSYPEFKTRAPERFLLKTTLLEQSPNSNFEPPRSPNQVLPMKRVFIVSKRINLVARLKEKVA
jgi:hypothetical protein